MLKNVIHITVVMEPRNEKKEKQANHKELLRLSWDIQCSSECNSFMKSPSKAENWYELNDFTIKKLTDKLLQYKSEEPKLPTQYQLLLSGWAAEKSKYETLRALQQHMNVHPFTMELSESALTTIHQDHTVDFLMDFGGLDALFTEEAFARRGLRKLTAQLQRVLTENAKIVFISYASPQLRQPYLEYHNWHVHEASKVVKVFSKGVPLWAYFCSKPSSSFK